MTFFLHVDEGEGGGMGEEASWVLRFSHPQRARFASGFCIPRYFPVSTSAWSLSPPISPPHHKDLASFQLFGSQEPSKSPSCHQLSDPGRVSSNRSQTHLQTALCSLNPFVEQSPPSSEGLLFAFLTRRHEMPGERVQLPSDLESPASQRGSLSVIPAASSQSEIKDSMRGRQ